MNLRTVLAQAFLACVLAGGCNTSQAFDWRGSLSSEFTFYPESSVGVNNWRVNSSLAAEVELTHDLTDNIRSFYLPAAVIAGNSTQALAPYSGVLPSLKIR